MPHYRPVSHDEAQLTLNDHLGKEVEVFVEAARGDFSTSVLTARGPLRHWQNDADQANLWRAMHRDDIAGSYDVGRHAIFDVTHLDVAWWLQDEGEAPYGLAFSLADGVTLSVVWGVPRPT